MMTTRVERVFFGCWPERVYPPENVKNIQYPLKILRLTRIRKYLPENYTFLPVTRPKSLCPLHSDDYVDDTPLIDFPRPARALLIVDGQISASEFRVPLISYAFAHKIRLMDFTADPYGLRSVGTSQKLVSQEFPNIGQ